MEKLTEIHENILSFLLKKQEDNAKLFFTLRSNNRYGRLEKGYWFLGADSVIISFWDGRDWKAKTPNMFLEIGSNSQTSLRFTAKDSEIKANFFKNVIDIIPGFTQVKSKKGKEYNIWFKNYDNKNDDYVKNLEEFLENDKKRIDDLLNLELKYNKQLEIKMIDNQEKYLKKIEKYRGKAINKKEAKKELELLNIELQNIGHFNKLEIDLSQQITCILGENGTGKSTILRAIALSIAGTDYPSANYFDTDKIENLFKIKEVSKTAEPVYHKSGEIILKYFTNNDKTNKIFFTNKGNNLIEIDDTYTSETTIDIGIFPIPIIAFPQIQESNTNIDAPKMPFDNNLPNLNDIIHILYNIPDKRFIEVKKWLFTTFLLATKDKKQKELLDFFHKIISRITNEDIKINKIGGLPGNENVAVSVGNNEIPIEMISQGLNNVLSWIGFLIKRLFELNLKEDDFRKTKAIVLIDEIDTHLHPKWQRNILYVLTDEFPNIQFIITTHSPIIATTVKPEHRYIVYKNEDNKIVGKQGYAPEGDTPNNLLRFDFEYKELLGKKGLEKYNRFLQLKTKIPHEKDEMMKEKMLSEYLEIANIYRFGK